MTDNLVPTFDYAPACSKCHEELDVHTTDDGAGNVLSTTYWCTPCCRGYARIVPQIPAQHPHFPKRALEPAMSYTPITLAAEQVPATKRLPTLGTIVLYTLTAEDAHRINRRRWDATNHEHELENRGIITNSGNETNEGDVYPLVITRIWDSLRVNGQVMLDGNDTYWVTSVREGTTPRTFSWPIES